MQAERQTDRDIHTHPSKYTLPGGKVNMNGFETKCHINNAS